MNITELAKQASGGPAWSGMEWLWEDLQKFADLVEAAARADEREACAKIAELAEPYQTADLIRARGTT
jgi:hypothetical protein